LVARLTCVDPAKVDETARALLALGIPIAPPPEG
jgi:hypothetical protein